MFYEVTPAASLRRNSISHAFKFQMMLDSCAATYGSGATARLPDSGSGATGKMVAAQRATLPLRAPGAI